MADYNSTLGWLQGLLSGPNWKYSLSREQLGTEAALRREALAEQSRQAAAELALQKVIADWQNQLARQQQRQAEQQQRYGQQRHDYETSSGYLGMQRGIGATPAMSELSANALRDFYNRMTANPTLAAQQSNYLWDLGMPGYSLGATRIATPPRQ